MRWLVAALLALGAMLLAAECGEGQQNSCDGETEGVSCDDRPDKCKDWRRRNFLETQQSFTNKPWMVRKLGRCNAKKKRRCCRSMGEDGLFKNTIATGPGPGNRRMLQTKNDSTISCQDPVFDERTGQWSKFIVRAGADLDSTKHGLPPGEPLEISLFGDTWVPSACVFFVTEMKRRLGAVFEEDDDDERVLPEYGVVNLETPSVGKCNLKPAGNCSCSENRNCPNRCLELEQEIDGHLSLEACAARCNGYFWCAGIEYMHDDTETINRCWLILRPFPSVTAEVDGEEREFPSFQVGYSLAVPPPTINPEATPNIKCYGRNNATALNSKVHEVKTGEGRHGACDLGRNAVVEQVCGPYVPGLGLCGPSVCSAYCTQNASCVGYMTHDKREREECHLIFNNPTPTLANEKGKYHCFAVNRSVSAEDSDWFHVYRDFGFRDLVNADNKSLNLFNPKETSIPVGPGTKAPTTPDPTASPSEPPFDATPDPTASPSEAPFSATMSPSEVATDSPTEAPSDVTSGPSEMPSEAPFDATAGPSEVATDSPTDAPFDATPGLTEMPTNVPTTGPNNVPTVPTSVPTPEEEAFPTRMPTSTPTKRRKRCTLSQKKKRCCTGGPNVNYANQRCCSGDKTSVMGRECCTYNPKDDRIVKCCYKAAGIESYCIYGQHKPIVAKFPDQIEAAIQAFNESVGDDWVPYPEEWDDW